MIKKYFFLFGICFMALFGATQVPLTDDEVIETILSRSFESTETIERIDLNQLRTELEILRTQPVSIYSDQMEVFVQLGLLTLDQSENIQNYLAKNGNVSDAQELLRIEGIDYSTLRLLLPYIAFKNRKSIQVISNKRKDRVTAILHTDRIFPDSRGFLSSERRFKGIPWRFMVRLKAQVNPKISWGLNLENDAGEVFRFDVEKHKLGPDHSSLFFSYAGSGKIQRIIIGDYQAGFGQGLAFWKGMAFGKSANSVPVRKVRAGIRPYAGNNEFEFLRGFALELKLKQWSILSFGSIRKLNANLMQLGFTSIDESGLNRTELQQIRIGNLQEALAGFHFLKKGEKLTFGFTGVKQRFSEAAIPGTALYQLHHFSGRDNTILGTHATYEWKSVIVFGEAAISQNRKGAGLMGITLTPDKRLALSIFQRWLSPAFQPISSAVLSAASRTNNESGTYIGLEFIPLAGHKLNGYIDLYRFPWLTYQADAPTYGMEYLLNYYWEWSDRTQFSVRFRSRSIEESPSGSMQIQTLESQQFRMHLQHDSSQRLSFRLRYEKRMVISSQDKTSGDLFYIESIFKPENKKWSTDIRFSVFSIDSFDARIYAYERDVYFVHNVRSYQGIGQKVFTNLKLRCSRWMKMAIRGEYLIFPFQKTIGSGDDLTAANHRWGFKFQLFMNW